MLVKYESYLSNYLDDWIVATPDGEEGLKLHCCIIYEFLDLMETLFYFLKIGKCELKQSRVKFLGWLVIKDGIIVDPSKVAGLAEWPCKLQNVKEV